VVQSVGVMIGRPLLIAGKLPWSFGSEMSIEFTASECGFNDGLGGASNSEAEEEYHYILFGRQTDTQHPEYSGTYFEFDDQSNGDVNIVECIVITNSDATFTLSDSETIRVLRNQNDVGWQEFLRGIAESFEANLIKA
jgi:hypothetical protein